MPDATTHEFAAVLTGDIRESRKMGDQALRDAMGLITRTAKDIGEDSYIHTRFNRHRGDGWQVFLSNGETALRATLRIIAALTAEGSGLQTRIAIGLGCATLPKSGDLGSASGPAFVGAGDALALMEKHERITIHRSGPFIPAVVGLLDWQAQNWTAAQAQALFEALRNTPPTQEEIATRYGVSRQAIQLRLAGTGLPAIREALSSFESHVKNVWHGEHP